MTEVTLNLQIPDEAQRALLDELIWNFHRGTVKLRATSTGSDEVFSITYVSDSTEEKK